MGRYSNKHDTAGRNDPSGLTSAIARLHLTQNSNGKARHGPALPRRPISYRPQILQSALAIAAMNQMDIDAEEKSSIEPIHVMQIVELVQDIREEGQSNQDLFASIKECTKLLQTCGLSSEMHLAYLKQWQNTTCQMLSSPVFVTCRFWSHQVLLWSLGRTSLHCALLAVAGLQYFRSMGETEKTRVQHVYRLYAEAVRRLRYADAGQEPKFNIATQVCLLFFDYLSGNQDAWEGALFMVKWSMKRADYTNLHPIGRYFFYTVAKQDCMAMYTADALSKSDASGKYLAWDGLLEPSTMATMAPSFDAVDQIGVLYAELLRLQSCFLNMGRHVPTEDLDNINQHLARWKESFPLDLQTYAYEGDVRDKSCFLHALTCNGGSRAVALHCLFSEFMLHLLDYERRNIVASETDLKSAKDHGRAVDSQLHQHAMTICRLVQSLTSSAHLLDYDVAANLNAVLGSLYMAGQNLFSKDGKAWLDRLLRWISTSSGDIYADNLADKLAYC